VAFPIRRVEAEDSVCKYCGGEARCAIQENVNDVIGIPIHRSYLHFARCRACGMLDHRKVPRPPELADSRPARKWFFATGAFLAAITVACIVGGIWHAHRQRAYALSPIVGDLWTIQTDAWPDKLTGQKYLRVQITGVYDEAIGLMGCKMSYSTQEAARQRCDTYTLTMFGVPRAKLADIYDRAVKRVDTERDDHKPLVVAFGFVIGIYAAWRVLLERWRKKIGLTEL
jgi:hypothetical protein